MPINKKIKYFSKALKKIDKDLKKIDKERSRFKSYTITSFIFLVFGAILPTPILNLFLKFCNVKFCGIKPYDTSYDPYINAISQIIVGTSASILAASLIEIFSALRNIWIKEADEDFFRLFFGPDLEQGTVAVVIPNFAPGIIPQEIVATLPDSLKSMVNGDSTFLSSSDTKALTNIEILFKKYGIERPELRFADETLDDLYEKYKTVFFIGLFSNIFLRKNLNKENTLFYFEKFTLKRNIREPRLRLADIDRHGMHRHPKNSARIFYDKNNNEHGLIAKFMHGNVNVFVIGGISARLTIKCSEYLLNNWQIIYSLIDDSHNKEKLRDFAICMKSYNSEELKPAYKFIKN